jgi:hypothetical protein
VSQPAVRNGTNRALIQFVMSGNRFHGQIFNRGEVCQLLKTLTQSWPQVAPLTRHGRLTECPCMCTMLCKQRWTTHLKTLSTAAMMPRYVSSAAQQRAVDYCIFHGSCSIRQGPLTAVGGYQTHSFSRPSPLSTTDPLSGAVPHNRRPLVYCTVPASRERACRGARRAG